MNIWQAKDPAETVAYTADWADQIGGDTIASHTVTPTGDAVINDGELAGAQIKFLVSGGTSETTTTFLIVITTTAGQILQRTYSLYVLDSADSFRPATTTKRQLVDAMFNEVALNGWELDITAEEKNTALNRLDAMMWELKGRGLDLGYNFPTAMGAGNLADELGCPDMAFSGLAIQGALRLCPTMRKKLSQESREALNSGMKAVRAAANNLVPSMSLARGTPLGSGNRASYSPFARVA